MNGEQNFKKVVVEQFYEVCMSFQDDSYEVNKETIDIGQELVKIKKLHVAKGEIVANFVNCLQTMYKDVPCWATDYHWFCERYGGVCSYNSNCHICAFHRKMEIIFENAAQCYLKRDFRKFCE